jgi:hypothetical protein
MGEWMYDRHFLDLGTSWRWVVSFTPRPLYPRERDTGTHFIRGLVDPRAGLDDMEKRKFFTLPGLELPPLLVVQPVASCYTDWAIPAQSSENYKTMLSKCKMGSKKAKYAIKWYMYLDKSHTIGSHLHTPPWAGVALQHVTMSFSYIFRCKLWHFCARIRLYAQPFQTSADVSQQYLGTVPRFSDISSGSPTPSPCEYFFIAVTA